MTTFVRTRNPLDALNMNAQPQRRKSKRLAGELSAYDEEDDGFKFTRRSKRSKMEAAAPEPAPVSGPAATKSKQSKVQHPEPQAEARSRRKMTFSTPKKDDDVIRLPKRTTRNSTRLSIEKIRDGTSGVNGTALVEPDTDSLGLVGESITDENRAMGAEAIKESTKIALPYSDTPVINRNKELRRKTGNRRSSLGMRGRRASSLIENGHNAIPHHQVETSQFYKHIEAEGLSEPRRMKQLLTWCGERALGAKPSHNISDSAAVLAARAIQEQILKDFANRSEMSEWFSRDEAPRHALVVKKPNPRNIENVAKIGELEERIKRLEMERAQLRAMREPAPALPPLLDKSGSPPSPSILNPTLLDPEDANILSFLRTSSTKELISKVGTRLKSIQENIEFQVDQFADGVHKLEQACQTMEVVSNRVLALSAVRLDERENEEREKTGTKDLPIQEVLRTLSRIIPTGGT